MFRRCSCPSCTGGNTPVLPKLRMTATSHLMCIALNTVSRRRTFAVQLSNLRGLVFMFAFASAGSSASLPNSSTNSSDLILMDHYQVPRDRSGNPWLGWNSRQNLESYPTITTSMQANTQHEPMSASDINGYGKHTSLFCLSIMDTLRSFLVLEKRLATRLYQLLSILRHI